MSEYQRLKERSRVRKESKDQEFKLREAVVALAESLMEASRQIGVECMADGHQVELFRHDTGACVILRCVSCDVDRAVLDGSYESLCLPLEGSRVH